MSLRRLKFRAGVIKDDPQYAAMGYATDSEHVRFVRGAAESIQGYEDAGNGYLMRGKARGMHAWDSNAGLSHMAIGTHSKLYVYADGQVYDITPLSARGTLNGALSTTAASNVLSVAHMNAGVRAGDTVYLNAAQAVGGTQVGENGTLGANPFYTVAGSPKVLVNLPNHGFVGQKLMILSGASTINGVTVNGTFTATVGDANTLEIQGDVPATATGYDGGSSAAYQAFDAFTVTGISSGGYTVGLPAPATATASGGGTVTYAYELSPGLQDGTSTGGYSTGGYGQGPYGFSPDPAHKADFLPRTWSLDNFGEDLLANPLGGTIYEWDLNVSQRAVPLANAPAQVDYMRVTAERVVMAFGCSLSDGSGYAPMNVRWTDVATSDPTAWTLAPNPPASVAGETQLSGGSALIAARITKAGILLWSDIGLWFGTYDTTNLEYVFNTIATGCGLMAPHAVAEKDGSAYWLSSQGFFEYAGGTPGQIVSPCRKWLLDNMPAAQAWKCYVHYDIPYQALMFHYPRNQVEISDYVRFDTLEANGDPQGGWSVGTYPMTAWFENGTYPQAYSVRTDGMLCRHTEGLTADAGQPRTHLIDYTPNVELSGDDDGGGDGDEVCNVNRFVLDALLTGTLTLDLYARRWPNGPITHKGPFPQSGTTVNQRCRIQGRQVGFRLSSTGTIASFRLGAVRADVSDGPLR